MTAYPELPEDVMAKIEKARRLEWITLGFMASIVAVMYLVMGSSQAMKTAWIEDMLSLLPPVLFLVSSRLERKPPTDKFPYGFHRAGSLAFFGAAMALCAMGLYLLYESVHALIIAEHPTVGSIAVFGQEVWLGWPMMAALAYSVIPPVILGRMKRPLAKDIRDKVLYTDADMNAADWQTGVAGMAGIIGIGFGWWWADAAAAGFISFSIIKDGGKNLMVAIAELMDGFPREVGGTAPSETATGIKKKLGQTFPDHTVQLRETGRYIRALITPDKNRATVGEDFARDSAGANAVWLIEASRSLPDDGDEPENNT